MNLRCVKCKMLVDSSFAMDTKEGLLVLCPLCCAKLVRTQLEKYPHRTEYVWEWVEEKRKPTW